MSIGHEGCMNIYGLHERLSDPQRIVVCSPPILLRISGTVEKECDLRIEVASDGFTPESVIRAFEKEFETKKNECVVIIVRAGVDLEKWTVAGFDDAGTFCIFEIDDPNHELSQELLIKPVDEHRIVDLATSCLGRCQAGTLPGSISRQS